MNLLNSLLESPIVQRSGWTLLHSLWQMTAAGLLLAIALAALRNRGAQARYAAACGMMLLVAAMPVATFLMIDAPARPQDVQRRGPQPIAAARSVTNERVASPQRPEAQFHPIVMDRSPSGEPATPAIATRLTWTSIIPMDRLSRALPWLVLSWIAGVLAMSVWNFGGWLAVQQLRRLSTKPAGAAAQEMLQKLASRAGWHRPIRLMRSALAQTPLVIGVLKPMILLPASLLTDLPPLELESILAHELAHIRRHDYLVNLLQSVIETLLFYHPAVWWISRQIRLERENCCDDLALMLTTDRAAYVRALATVALVRAPMLAPAASGGNLLARLRRIVGSPDTAAPRSSRWIAGVVLSMLLLAGATPRLLSMARAGEEPKMPAANDSDTIRVRGRVFDPQGKPVAGARVSANPNWSQVTDPTLPHVIGTATTNAEGRFDQTFKKSAASVFNYSAGRSGADLWKGARIVAAAEGYGLAWKKFDAVDEHGDLLLNLVVDEPVEGRIIDLEGRPIQGVTVTVNGMVGYILAQWSGNNKDLKARPDFDGLAYPQDFSPHPAPTTSDADGRFRITGMGRERLIGLNLHSAKVFVQSVSVLTRDTAPFVQTPWGPDREKLVYYGSKFELAAPPAMAIEGTVRDASTHLPLAGVRVESTRREAFTLTDAQGHYRLEGIHKSTGNNAVTLRYDGQPYIPIQHAEVKPTLGSTPTTLDLELHRGIWVSGKVTDKSTGAPVPAYVDYWPADSNKAAAGIEPFIGYVNSPSYAMTAADGSYRLAALPGAGVIAVSSSTGLYRTGVGFDQIKDIGPGGRVLKLVTPFVSSDNKNAIRQVDLPATGTSDPVDFQLDPGQSLQIACVDPAGKPLDGLSVRGPRSGNFLGGYEPVEGSVFESPAFAPGETRVLLIYNRQKTLARAITPRISDFPSQKMTVTLEPLAQVTGRLLNADGDIIKHGMITADVKPQAAMHSSFGNVSVNVGDDGRFKLELPVGVDWVLETSDMVRSNPSEMIPRLTPQAGKTTDIGDFRVKANRDD